MSTCEHCDGQGRIEVGEYGVDCAAIHGMGGRMPDPPGWERCEACEGTGNDLGRINAHRAPRGFWTAHFSKCDDLSLTGVGATKDLAVNDLIEHADELGLIDFQAAHALPVDEVRCGG